MSLKTWRQEFYPISADDIVEKNKFRVSGDIVLLKHSLSKWIGFREENLNKHGVKLGKLKDGVKCLYDEYGVEFPIDAKSCALCVSYLTEDNDFSCDGCPLFEFRGKASCDDQSLAEADAERSSPWWAFVTYSNPEAMIGELEQTLRHYEKS